MIYFTQVDTRLNKIISFELSCDNEIFSLLFASKGQ